MRLLKSFYYALSGVIHCIKYETNFRVHIVAMLSVIIFSSVYKVPAHEKAILVILISLVMVSELINTSIEAMVDSISPDLSEKGKIAKDSAAGAVFVFALGAVICAVFLFSDIKVWIENVIPFIKEYWYYLLIYIVLSWLFIFKCGSKKSKDERL